MGEEFKINNFDLLRIFAASQVMLCHAILHLQVAAPAPLMKLLSAFPGVPVFFVISGFLISASYERSPSLKSYCRNRVLRIFPGLWTCIIFTVLAASLCGFSFANGQAVIWIAGQLAGAIYTPGFLKDFGTGSYNGSLWTIPVELQFYILLPVLYWLIRKGTGNQAAYFWLAWLLFTAIGVAAGFVLSAPDGGQSEPALQKLFRYSFFPHFFLFISGVMLQRLKAHRSPWMAGKGFYWLAAYLALHYAVPTGAASHVPMTLLLAAVTVSMAYTAPRAAQRTLRGNDISYGVYIYHGLLINLFVELGLSGRAGSLLLLVGCTYLAGYVSWVAIERPFLRRKKQSISAVPVDAGREGHWVSSMRGHTGKT